MKIRVVAAIVLALAFCAVAVAQDANTQTQNQGQRGARGGWGGGGMMGGADRVLGTVTGVATDHYTIKTEAGEIYTVHFSANTRILKQTGGGRGSDPGGDRSPAGGQGMGARGGNPPQAIKPTDVKVGDVIAASGQMDAAAKSVGAIVVMQIAPERAKQMREMQASYGKTWLMGKVTAIDGVKVSIMGGMDHAPHMIVADENTSFRKHRDPITLADIQVGDTVRVEGAVKGDNFAATSVAVMAN